MEPPATPDPTPAPAPIEGRNARLDAGVRGPRRVVAFASQQRGVVSRRQLRELDITEDVIESWLERGWLTRLHECVYAVGHRALPAGAAFAAAVLAGGASAALSHRSAAAHRDLLPRRRGDVDVMVRRSGRSQTGIRWHRPRVYGPEDVEIVDGIPCTTVARTLVDLAGVVRPWQLEKAVRRAEYLGILDVKAIAAVFARIKAPRGKRHLRRILTDERLEGEAAESALEQAYGELIARAGIERPEQQVEFRLGPAWVARVDFHWPEHRLVVEVDGPHHALPIFAAADARRDARLAELGLRVERFTEVDVEGDPAATVQRTVQLTPSRAA